MPVSAHCPLCGTITVPGPTIIVDPPGGDGSTARITVVCPQCWRYLRIGVREGLELTRVLMCGARIRPRTPIGPVEADRLAHGDWDAAAVEELML